MPFVVPSMVSLPTNMIITIDGDIWAFEPTSLDVPMSSTMYACATWWKPNEFSTVWRLVVAIVVIEFISDWLTSKVPSKVVFSRKSFVAVPPWQRFLRIVEKQTIILGLALLNSCTSVSLDVSIEWQLHPRALWSFYAACKQTFWSKRLYQDLNANLTPVNAGEIFSTHHNFPSFRSIELWWITFIM